MTLLLGDSKDGGVLVPFKYKVRDREEMATKNFKHNKNKKFNECRGSTRVWFETRVAKFQELSKLVTFHGK